MWPDFSLRRRRMRYITVGSWVYLMPGPLGPLGASAIFLRDLVSSDRVKAIVLGKALARRSRGRGRGGLTVVTILVAAILAYFFSEIPMPAFWVILALLLAMWAGFLWALRRPKSSPQDQEPEQAFP